MDKNGEVIGGTTPCLVCGHPSLDGYLCGEHGRQASEKESKTAEPQEPRSLMEDFLDYPEL